MKNKATIFKSLGTGVVALCCFTVISKSQAKE